MELVRIDSEKNIGRKVLRIVIKIGHEQYTITEEPDDKIVIHAEDGDIFVIPVRTNKILIGSESR